MKLSNLTRTHKKHATWSQEKRIQAVTQYLALGNMNLVSATTGINVDLLRSWKMKPWWKETEIQIRSTENLQLDKKLSAIVERSLDAVADRLDNGEVVLNNKTGELVRKPVLMKDASNVAKDLLTKRELLRGNATERKEMTQVSVADQLKSLAIEFAKWSKAPPKEVVDVEMVEIVDETDEAQGDEEDQVDEGKSLSEQVYDSDHGDGLESLTQSESFIRA